MHRIAIIIPYFGKWPSWFALFLDSCYHNPTIDFYFFTDCDTSTYALKDKSNVFLYKISFEEYCKIVSKKLEIDFHPDNAYKLCDLKPFYGLVHSDILMNYDFWGFGDIDLIWGNLRSFYTEELLGRCDVISNHSDRVSGHLSLIRNNERMNNLIFSIPNWKQQLQSEQHYAIDEIAFTKKLYPAAVFMWKVHRHIIFRLPFINEFKSHVRFCTLFNRVMMPRRICFKERYTTPWFNESDFSNIEIANKNRWIWKDGHIYDLHHKKELPYLHFLGMKKYWPTDCYHLTYPYTDVIINLNGIYNAEVFSNNTTI